jgi:hypothetical protein
VATKKKLDIKKSKLSGLSQSMIFGGTRTLIILARQIIQVQTAIK